MCTGGILLVREIQLTYLKIAMDEKFEYFLLSYNEKKVDSMRIHHTWGGNHYTVNKWK
jgi:hypothetical protein